MQPGHSFLTAEWRDVVMANYVIDPEHLHARVPAGTELDDFNGRTYVSMVAFKFLNTRIKSIAIPYHRDFEEINLRFYVRRKAGGEWKRGVVFVKEIVPRMAISFMGYTRQRDGTTKEYEVEHPAWTIWRCSGVRTKIEVETLYGAAFLEALTGEPESVFIADGSAVRVSKGRRL